MLLEIWLQESSIKRGLRDWNLNLYSFLFDPKLQESSIKRGLRVCHLYLDEAYFYLTLVTRILY